MLKKLQNLSFVEVIIKGMNASDDVEPEEQDEAIDALLEKVAGTEEAFAKSRDVESHPRENSDEDG